jgi:hypothetical protein
VIACGALGASIREIAARRRWEVELYLLPSLLHNRPREIASRAESLARRLQAEGRRVVLAYADCGTYGALDKVCERLSISRLGGLHCYDVFAGPAKMRELFEADAGTYVLTDFLVRSFRRSVLSELGLVERPELWPEYFANYGRLVWLAQCPTPALATEAEAIAAMFALPLTVIAVGVTGLERELARLVGEESGHGPVTAPDVLEEVPVREGGSRCAAG